MDADIVGINANIASLQSMGSNNLIAKQNRTNYALAPAVQPGGGAHIASWLAWRSWKKPTTFATSRDDWFETDVDQFQKSISNDALLNCRYLIKFYFPRLQTLTRLMEK